MEENNFQFVLIQFSRANIELADLINAYALQDFECDGVEEFSLEENRVDQILGERAYSGGDVPESLIDEVQAATLEQEEVTYKYFFAGPDSLERASRFVAFLDEDYSMLPYYLAEKEIEDWNAEWKKFYTPIVISERLHVIPEWLKGSRSNAETCEVYIYPGMGFGTGTHETTYLCLKLFEEIRSELRPAERCLDFGCGSGILGIAAMKTLKMPTTFCDIDRSALDNCVQNLVLNFDGENVQGTHLVIRERYTAEPNQLVFANILDHVLKLEKATIVESISPGGYLIVSGLLNHQVDGIVSEYKELQQLACLSKNDWSAILFKRNM